MWFRNLQIYRLSAPIGLSPEELHQQLDKAAFQPCGALQPQSLGWVAPLGREGVSLTHAAQGCTMICLRREERLLPGAVLREVLEQRVAEREQSEGRSVGRKERLQLRDELVFELMPKAFTRSVLTYAYIDNHHGWVVVDCATPKRAEELLSLLRQTLGSLKVRPLAVRESPAAVMSRWLSEQPAEGFQLLEECELREPVEEGGIVRCRRQALDSDEIALHLQAGKRAVRLAVEWDERLSTVLGDDLTVRRLRFLDLVQEAAADAQAEDAAARFDVDFNLMTLELGRFIPALIEAFGGLAEE